MSSPVFASFYVPIPPHADEGLTSSDFEHFVVSSVPIRTRPSFEQRSGSKICRDHYRLLIVEVMPILRGIHF